MNKRTRQLRALENAIQSGARTEAAEYAKRVAMQQPPDGALLAQVINLIADELVAVGDSHPCRGRPPQRRLATTEVDHDGNLVIDTSNYAATSDANLLQWARAMSQQAALEDAVQTYRLLVVARDIVDGRSVAAYDMACLIWHLGESTLEGCKPGTASQQVSQMATLLASDPQSGRAIASDVAQSVLKSWKLYSVTRQQFRPQARARICARHGISESQLKKLFSRA